jgi:hypothetical protein
MLVELVPTSLQLVEQQDNKGNFETDRLVQGPTLSAAQLCTSLKLVIKRDRGELGGCKKGPMD